MSAPVPQANGQGWKETKVNDDVGTADILATEIVEFREEALGECKTWEIRLNEVLVP